jgi:hypothetical protein
MFSIRNVSIICTYTFILSIRSQFGLDTISASGTSQTCHNLSIRNQPDLLLSQNQELVRLIIISALETIQTRHNLSIRNHSDSPQSQHKEPVGLTTIVV